MDWKLVIDPRRGGYWPGLDPEREYEFRRFGDETVQRYRLADVSPYFNVGGLLWREPPEPKPKPCDWTKLQAYRP